MFAQTDALILSCFTWNDYLEGAPELQTLSQKNQRQIVAAYLDENLSELNEVLSYLHDAFGLTVAKMISGTVHDEIRHEFDLALFYAAYNALSLTIDDRIATLYERYVETHGRFSYPSRTEPSELIGWNDDA